MTMNAKQMAEWITLPFASDAEEREAFDSPEYRDQFHGEAFRQAVIIKKALSLPANAPTIERPLTITMSDSIGNAGKSLEEELAASPLKGVLAVNQSRLGLSGNQAAAEGAIAAEAQAELERSAAAIDATAKATGDLIWDGRGFVPRK